MDCSICLQKFVHPVKLPCGHIFCFLCIKGCALHRKRCPMCRGRFSLRLFDDPQLISDPELTGENASQRDTVEDVLPLPSDSSLYRWFYEGYNGWWQYDERTSAELEDAFQRKLPFFDITVAGFIYTIDFLTMSQMRKDCSGRRRQIKRDLRTCEKKGIAGIKLTALPAERPRFPSSNTGDALEVDKAGGPSSLPVTEQTTQLSSSGEGERLTSFHSSGSPQRSRSLLVNSASLASSVVPDSNSSQSTCTSTANASRSRQALSTRLLGSCIRSTRSLSRSHRPV